MKKYRVMFEYIDKWTADQDEDLVVTEDELSRLAYEWGVSKEEVMNQIEEIA